MKIGNKVSFKLNGEIHDGEIYVIDRNGTYFSRKPSVDIMVKSENMLYKHVPMEEITSIPDYDTNVKHKGLEGIYDIAKQTIEENNLTIMENEEELDVDRYY